MKHNRKWLSLLLTGTLLISALAGCDASKQTSAPKKETEGPVVVEDVRLYLMDDNKSVDLNRDRTRITYEYDYYGNITKATYQDLWNGGDPKVVFEAKMEYNQQGRPTRVEAPMGYYIYSYDDRDQLVNVKVYWEAVVSDPNDDYVIFEYSRTENGEYPYTVTAYDQKGYVTSVEYYNLQMQLVKKRLGEEENENFSTITYEYSAKGNLISKKQDCVSDWNFSYHYTYTDEDYDQFGNCLVKWGTISGDWTVKKRDYSHLYAYFKLDGGITQMRQYFEEHDTSRYDLYEYDSNGRLIKFQDYTMGGYEESIYHPYVVWGDGLMNLFLQTRPSAHLSLTGEY